MFCSVLNTSSGICHHIQSYLALLKDIHAYWGTFRLILTYSAICITFAYSQPCHILSHGIFRTEAYLEPCKTLTRHIQNPVIWHYSAIFRHIQNLVQRLHIHKPSIIGILEIQDSSIIESRRIFTILPYLPKFTNIENSDIFKMQHIFRNLSMI